MNKLNHLLRRLKPAQILVVTVIAWLAALAVVTFGLGPLAFFLLAFAGEALASVGSVIVTVGGLIAATLYLPKPFVKAYLDRKYDDEVGKLILAYAESRRNG